MSHSEFEIKTYEFSSEGLTRIQDNHFAKNLWPVVYILNGGKKPKAYVGESTNVISRINTHLSNDEKNKLNSLELISSKKFNKSAALDIEANLISYMAADGKFEILNSNLGIANHNYYQKQELYHDVFIKIWDKLLSKGVVEHTLLHLNNSDIFKYSPYKSLSLEQEQGLHDILKCMLNPSYDRVVVEGGAGTGKTILAIYLFKLLFTQEAIYKEDLGEGTTTILKVLVQKFKKKHPNPKIALVIPMSSFRDTLKKAFRSIQGLSAAMVISPSEAAKNKYDLLVVDESHRLRRRVNLGAYFGQFDKNSEYLGLDKNTNTELDWVLMNSNKTVLFYDDKQSIKPSDVLFHDFEALKKEPTTITTELKSQFRSKGGNKYSQFVDDIFAGSLGASDVFTHQNYELLLYDSLGEMIEDVKLRDQQYGLSRLVAGYAWPWVSKRDSNFYDIEIDDIKLRWNSTNIDWINSENALNEVGCIHTTQGYDLNYTGIIFGPEISYDPQTKEVFVIEENYFDKNGKQSITDPEELKDFIINIYKTILLRGIRGTYIYVCDLELRKYLAQYIPLKSSRHNEENKVEYLPACDVQPFVNAVPVYDLDVAAGGFSESQDIDGFDWVAIPDGILPAKNLFACFVVGESMNKIIPNGSLCLFRQKPAGSRNGKIVLVQHRDIADPDNGGSYTVKTYFSEKTAQDGLSVNKRIVLRPETTMDGYAPIILEDAEGLEVIAEFVRVIG